MTQQIQNGFYRLSVKALVLDETKTKFLATQTQNGKWTVPGGGLEWGEEPLVGLRRELREEMGLEAKSISPRPSYFSIGERKDLGYCANVFFETEFENLNFTPSNECVAIKFVSKDEAKTMDFYSVLDSFIDAFESK